MKILNEIEVVKTQLSEIKELLQKKTDSKEDILTADATMKLLSIDRSTFDRWRKLGLIQVYNINRRLYTKRNEILEALEGGALERA